MIKLSQKLALTIPLLIAGCDDPAVLIDNSERSISIDQPGDSEAAIEPANITGAYLTGTTYEENNRFHIKISLKDTTTKQNYVPKPGESLRWGSKGPLAPSTQPTDSPSVYVLAFAGSTQEVGAQALQTQIILEVKNADGTISRNESSAFDILLPVVPSLDALTFSNPNPGDILALNNPTIAWTGLDKQTGITYNLSLHSEVGCNSRIQKFAGVSTFSYALPALSDGNYFACITATDLLENQATPQEVAFMIDTKPPADASLIGPGITANTNPNISWILATDATTVTYDLSIDSDANCNNPMMEYPNAQNGFQTLGNLADGNYFACLRLRDAANNEANAEPVAFTIDSQAPMVFQVTVPADGTTTQNETPQVIWDLDQDASSYRLTLDTESGCPTPVQEYNTAISPLTLNTIDDAEYFLCLTAVDEAGNETTKETRFTKISGPDCSNLVGGTWVEVPGDPNYHAKDFCVMKYEAKNVGGIPTSQISSAPWSMINQNSDSAECASLGNGYQLISNAQWMAIGTNIATQSNNWSDGTVGAGSLNIGRVSGGLTGLEASGDNDACHGSEISCTSTTNWNNSRRTHTLSNGEAIWDLGSNAIELTSKTIDYQNIPHRNDEIRQYRNFMGNEFLTKTELIPQVAIDNSWGRQQRVGIYMTIVQEDEPDEEQAGVHTLYRGGFRDDVDVFSGIFSALVAQPNSELLFIASGFRCSYTNP